MQHSIVNLPQQYYELCVSDFKMLIRLLSILVLSTLMIPSISEAARTITSLPHYENFDNNNYESDLVWINNGATHEWRQTEGWANSGAARFTPPTSEGYSGLGQFTGLRENVGNLRQLNARILIKHGPEYHDNAGVNKLMIFNRRELDGSRNLAQLRPMIITKRYPDLQWQTYRPCHNTWCYPPNDSVTADEPLKFGNDTSGIRHDEWISVELEANLDDRVINIYIYTLDGAVSGLYAVNPFIDSSDPGTGVFAFIDIIGGYFNYEENLNASPGNYFYIDELVIDDSYIGPPPTFLQIPRSPVNLRAD